MMWQNEGGWIGLGVSALSLALAFVIRRVFVKILKGSAPSPDQELQKDE